MRTLPVAAPAAALLVCGRLLRWIGSLVIAATLVAGCAPKTPPQWGMLPQRPAAGPHHIVHVGGVKKVKSYDVPADEDQVIDGSLVVIAEDEITIEGTLATPKSGVSFALIAPKISVTGVIGSLARNGDARTASPKVIDVIDACSLSVDSDQFTVPVFVAPGDDLAIAASSKKACVFTLKGTIALSTGRNGTVGDLKLLNGENGGNVEIGTPFAVGAAKHVLKKNRTFGEAFPHKLFVVLPNAGVIAGSGGNGAGDGKGTAPDYGIVDFIAGDGGKGGSVNFVLDGIIHIASGAKAVGLSAGRGGNGGGINTGSYGTGPLDGTQKSPNALAASLDEGSGGDGGSVSVSARAGAYHDFPGDGGNPGLLSGTAGYGYSNPVGNGGDEYVHLGSVGTGGSGPNGKGKNAAIRR